MNGLNVFIFGGRAAWLPWSVLCYARRDIEISFWELLNCCAFDLLKGSIHTNISLGGGFIFVFFFTPI